MILSDRDIIEMNRRAGGVILPFYDHQITEMQGDYGPVKIPSYGLSAAGYDVRLGDQWATINNDGRCVHFRAEEVVLMPADSVLAHTMESVKIPRGLCARIEPKSTWSRQFLLMLSSPLEPGWHGQVTLELVNLSQAPIRLPAGAGIAQIQFHRLSADPAVSYADRNGGEGGKYQGQTGVTLARL